MLKSVSECMRLSTGMISVLFAFSFLLIIPLFPVQAVDPAPVTITVPDDYPSIQEAVNECPENGTILIKDGYYYENIVVNKTLKIKGESMEGTIIQGQNSSAAFHINGTGCEISDLSITGLRIYSALMIKSNNNVIDRVFCTNAVLGMLLDSCSGNEIMNSYFNYNSGAGIYFSVTYDNFVTNCEASETTHGNGVSFYYGYDNSLSYMTCNNNGGDGLWLYWLSNGNSFFECEASNNELNGFYSLDAERTTLEFCKARSNGDSGFNLGCVDSIFKNCSASNNGHDGMTLYHTENTEISSCQLHDNGRKGIYLKYSFDVDMSQCLIMNNNDTGITVAASSKTCTFTENSILNNGGGIQARDNGTGTKWIVDGKGNYWWDHPFRYPGSLENEGVWDTPYELYGTSGAQDDKPLSAPTYSQDLIGSLAPDLNDDRDNDGIPDSLDDLPDDAAASVDTDGDGFPDYWNDGHDGSDSDLTLDEFPDDPLKWEEKDPKPDTWDWVRVLVFVGAMLVLIILLMRLYVRGRKAHKSDDMEVVKRL